MVSNTRGIDARRPTTAAGHGTHDTTSSLTRFTLPNDQAIRAVHGQGLPAERLDQGLGRSTATGKGTATPVPVPARLGDPSTIKHVFLIVKENRTYDQVFGDIPEGNGDPALTQFGENVTPNQHALAKQFGLYDNTYDIGTNSAEGHNWLMQADNPEYTESSAGEYLRSYDTEDDALGHQKSGFIWTGAQAAGKTVRDFGEFQSVPEPSRPARPGRTCTATPRTWQATGQDTAYPIKVGLGDPVAERRVGAGLPASSTPSVPDIYRTEIWKQDFEKNGPANLNMFWLSNDHTGGPPNAAGPGRRQRPRGRPDRRRDLAQQVLEGLGDLRRRGRLPGRSRPRRRPPGPDPDHQPVRPARRRRQPLLLADHDDPHDRADPRDPADEPEGQRGHPDVRRVHAEARTSRRSTRCPTGPR